MFFPLSLHLTNSGWLSDSVSFSGLKLFAIGCEFCMAKPKEKKIHNINFKIWLVY